MSWLVLLTSSPWRMFQSTTSALPWMPPNGPLCIASASSREVCCRPRKTCWMNLPLMRSSSVCLCVTLTACRTFAVAFEPQARASSTLLGTSVDTARRGVLSCHGAWNFAAKSDCARLSLHHVRCCSLLKAPVASCPLTRSWPCWLQYGVTRRFGVGSPYGASYE